MIALKLAPSSIRPEPAEDIAARLESVRAGWTLSEYAKRARLADAGQERLLRLLRMRPIREQGLGAN